MLLLQPKTNLLLLRALSIDQRFTTSATPTSRLPPGRQQQQAAGRFQVSALPMLGVISELFRIAFASCGISMVFHLTRSRFHINLEISYLSEVLHILSALSPSCSRWFIRHCSSLCACTWLVVKAWSCSDRGKDKELGMESFLSCLSWL